MAEELEAKWNNLSLGKDEDSDDDVFVDDQIVNECKKENSLSLVGKLLLRKPYSLEAMKITFTKAWNLQNEVVIEEVSQRVFIFRFASVIDRGKVLFRQPWSFNKALIVFQEFENIDELNEISFNTCPFWVHLLGIPLGLSSEKVGRILGSKAGLVSEVEKRNPRSGPGIGMKVRASIDTSKPLKQGCWLTLSSGKKHGYNLSMTNFLISATSVVVSTISKMTVTKRFNASSVIKKSALSMVHL